MAKDAAGRARIAKARKNDFISRVGLKKIEKYIQSTSARFFPASTGNELLKIDNLPRVGAFEGGEAELEGSEVVPGAMDGLTVVLDGAEQFAHGPLESRLEP